MRVVVQRVSKASVRIDGKPFSSIEKGLLLFVGICPEDSEADVEYLARKIVNLRIFNDLEGVMNLSLVDVKGEVMVVSQFTLMASTRKGNRPSYIRAARHEIAIPLYERFVARMSELLSREIATGVFGADMKVELLNDGPVTIIFDSKATDF